MSDLDTTTRQEDQVRQEMLFRVMSVFALYATLFSTSVYFLGSIGAITMILLFPLFTYALKKWMRKAERVVKIE